MQLVGENGPTFELTILGYQFPAIVEDEWDSNWLNIRTHAQTERGGWSATDLVDMTERGAGLRILHTLEVPAASAIDDSIQNHPTPRLPKEIVARSLLEERLPLAGRARFQAKLRLQFDCPLEVDAESPGSGTTLRTPLPLVD